MPEETQDKSSILSTRKIHTIQNKMLDWYHKSKRSMPWRNTKDPYLIWISEIMLQQTQVTTVIPYFEKFKKRFPTVKSLADARLDVVLKHWEGLGYYARARNLHKAAIIIRDNFSNCFPTTPDEIKQLPGIGRYTVGAIGSIAFGHRMPVLDGNVIRVLTRLFGIQEDPKSSEINKRLWNISEQLLPGSDKVGDFNQSLMELGAIICTPRQPQCTACPLSKYCMANASELTDVIPYRKLSRKLPHKVISAGVIHCHDKVLITQRPAKGLLGGLWEFPGGKKEQGESLRQCLVRELKEELDITVKTESKIMAIDHGYSHFTVTIHFYLCSIVEGTVKKLEVDDFKWVTPKQLSKYAFPAADQPIVKWLQENSVSRL